jgi:hypothetical protein
VLGVGVEETVVDAGVLDTDGALDAGGLGVTGSGAGAREPPDVTVL